MVLLDCTENHCVFQCFCTQECKKATIGLWWHAKSLKNTAYFNVSSMGSTFGQLKIDHKMILVIGSPSLSEICAGGQDCGKKANSNYKLELHMQAPLAEGRRQK